MDGSDKARRSDSDDPADRLVVPEYLKPYAEALGGLVITWSSLELQLLIMLTTMLGVEFTPQGDVLGNIEMKLRLKLLRSLSIVVGKDLGNNWLDRFTDLLRQIEDDLSAKRNRMIHDVWAITDTPGQIIRTSIKPKLTKQPLGIQADSANVTVSEIEALSFRVSMAADLIVHLTQELKQSSPKKCQ